MDWECGDRDKATCQRLIERLTRWRTRLYCADDYAVYDVLLPVGQLHTGKEETHGIERDNARQVITHPPHRNVFMLSNQQLTPISSRYRVESNRGRDTSRAASREVVLVASSGTLLA